MSRKILIDIIGILLIALVVVIGVKLSPLLLPKADITVQPDPACNLHKEACKVALPSGGTLELSMGTRPIPLVKPFQVHVAVQDLEPARVEIDFSGIDMNMGYNRLQMADQKNGVYMAEAILPVCITGQMDWQATVLLETGKERIAIPFRFHSGETL